MTVAFNLPFLKLCSSEKIVIQNEKLLIAECIQFKKILRGNQFFYKTYKQFLQYLLIIIEKPRFLEFFGLNYNNMKIITMELDCNVGNLTTCLIVYFKPVVSIF